MAHTLSMVTLLVNSRFQLGVFCHVMLIQFRTVLYFNAGFLF